MKKLLIALCCSLSLTANAQHITTLSPQADYEQAVTAYEQKAPKALDKLRSHLESYPDSPYKDRVYALIGSLYLFDEHYDEALAMLASADLGKLADDERNEMTYRMALCYLKTGNLKEAAIWFGVVKESSPRLQKDCGYHLSYIRYTQRRYDEALSGFLPLQEDTKYGQAASSYIAEIYLQKGQPDKAQTVAESFLSHYPNSPQAPELQRILGESFYKQAQYQAAVTPLTAYVNITSAPRRDALYMLGLCYYQVQAFGQAAAKLGRVSSIAGDALTQNAQLHLGLCYLQLKDKNKARMAFEQAATSNADLKVKEQAAYNYALCIHETSFSAFGESVKVFERFLNDFPKSTYTDKISSYLVEVYMNTRSYQSALESINRIGQPNRQILEAKQNILFHLGTERFANAALDESIRFFDESLALGAYNRQTKAEANYWKAEANYRLGNTAEAVMGYRTYLQLNTKGADETYALAHYNLGYCAFHRKDYDEARNWFSKFIQLGGAGNTTAWADALNRLGDCAFHTRNFTDARHYYRQATEKDPAVGDYSLYQLGLVAGLQKDYTTKIQSLDELSNKYNASSYRSNAAYEKGRAQVELGQNVAAIRTFRKLATDFPHSPLAGKALAEVGLLYYQDSNYNEAIEAYKAVATNYAGTDEAKLALRDLKSIYIDLNRVNEFAALAASLGNVSFDAAEQDSLTRIAADLKFGQKQYAEALHSYKQLKQSSGNAEQRLAAQLGALRSAYLLQNNDEIIAAANDALSDPKLSPELKAETHYYRAQAFTHQHKDQEALVDWKELAQDPRTLYGAEAKYRVSEVHYAQQQYAEAEAEILDFIEQSTPHSYWLARAFVLLSDVYVAQNKLLDAKQYLLSLKQNYQAKDEIQTMIENRLKKLK